MFNYFKEKTKNLININYNLINNKTATAAFKTFFLGLRASSLIIELIPGFISFGRIFYTDDTWILFILFFLFVFSFVVNSFCFIFISINKKVFINKNISLIIIGFCLVIMSLFFLTALIFTDFVLTETGYEVPFNILMYAIYILILLPLFGFYDYYLVRLVTKNI